MPGYRRVGKLFNFHETIGLDFGAAGYLLVLSLIRCNNNILYLFTIKSGTSLQFTGHYKIGELLRNIKMLLREINKK